MEFRGAKLHDSSRVKLFRSSDYNYDFNKETGLFKRWGVTEQDDPQYSEFGCEIADIEISRDGCTGSGTTERPKICQYCYKSNTSAEPKNMSLETFKIVLDKLGSQLTQVAFGITNIHANRDFLAIMQHCRAKGIIPNFTTSGADLDDEFLNSLPGLVGAVAVSYHGDKELCFVTVKRLLNAGIKQTNIHCVTADFSKTADFIYALANKIKMGLNLNALVLLSLKPKGRAKKLRNVTENEFNYLVEIARGEGVSLGFDSCSAHRAMKLFESEYQEMIEPCESGLFSLYLDVEAKFHPCSFSEGEWGEGIDVTKCDDFIRDVWLSPRVVEWRENLLKNNRECPLRFKEQHE